MKRLAHLVVLVVVTVASVSEMCASPLYVPNGTSGISSSANTNVGIGISAPTQKFEVVDGADAVTYVKASNYGTGSSSGAGFLIGAYGSGAAGSITAFGGYHSTKPYLVEVNGFQDLSLAAGGSERVRIKSDGSVGIGTATPAASLDLAGRTLKLSNLYPEYRIDFGGGQDTNWKTFANVTLGQGLYVGANFVVTVLDANNNWGTTVDAKSLTYYIRVSRSGGTQDDPNDAQVSGPFADYVRVVKTTTGVYQLQARQIGWYKRMILMARAYSISSLGASGQISYSQSLVNGATTGGIYTAAPSHKEYFSGGYFAGSVGIGTTSPTHKLSVNGTIRAKEVIVDTDWADYVFAEDYRLAPLSEVEAHIKQHKHLPDIPSAAEVAEKGFSMGEMQARMMAKIEELTLHVIRLEKRVQQVEAENEVLRQAAK